MILDLDHFVTADGPICRVAGNLDHPAKFVGYNIYSPDPDGDRLFRGKSPPAGGSSRELRLDPPATAAAKLEPSGRKRTGRSTVMATATQLTGVVAEHIRAVNDFDANAIAATFAEHAYVNDAFREIRGIGAIRRWVDTEMVGDSVTIEPIEVPGHHGDTIVRGRYDGTHDKTNLPGEPIMSNHVPVRDGKIVSLVVIRNQPSQYDRAGK